MTTKTNRGRHPRTRAAATPEIAQPEISSRTPDRRVYILTNNTLDNIAAVLDQREWIVDSGPPTTAFLEKWKAGAVACGVLDFSSKFDPDECALIEGFLASPSSNQISWVGLVDRSQHNNPFVKRIIGEYCFDYITQPVSAEQLASVVGHAFGMLLLQMDAETSLDPSILPSPTMRSPLGYEMLGTCEPMQKLYKSIVRMAGTDAPVFIAGETGTGKELTARAIHAHSARRTKPFVAVNCGAIPPALLQSELFGYERGAFTGANQSKIGRIEAAQGGTLFLDEIGDLPFESQASLLRFIQDHKVEKLGSVQTTDVDVRIVAATHVNMEEAIQVGRFRSDLYHRLCVLRLEQPPLRSRGGDIEIVARFMLNRYRGEANRRIRGFSQDAIVALHNYDWPGNVRELINRVRRAVVMSEGQFITAKDMELADAAELRPMSLAESREVADRAAIERALRRRRGRLAAAADDLDISRVTLGRLMNLLDMDITAFKTN